MDNNSVLQVTIIVLHLVQLGLQLAYGGATFRKQSGIQVAKLFQEFKKLAAKLSNIFGGIAQKKHSSDTLKIMKGGVHVTFIVLCTYSLIHLSALWFIYSKL